MDWREQKIAELREAEGKVITLDQSVRHFVVAPTHAVYDEFLGRCQWSGARPIRLHSANQLRGSAQSDVTIWLCDGWTDATFHDRYLRNELNSTYFSSLERDEVGLLRTQLRSDYDSERE